MEQVPCEILEFILGKLRPYDDFNNCKLVCKRWNSAIYDLQTKLEHQFSSALKNCDFQATSEHHESAKKITPRYDTCCCRLNNDIYMYGGVTKSSTFLNDFWKFNLNDRTWTRIISSGRCPPPLKRCTLVVYGNRLYLLGTVLESSLVFQKCAFYYFDTEKVEWHQVITCNDPPGILSNSATVHGNRLVVFASHQSYTNRFFNVTNDIFVYDFNTNNWSKPTISEKPSNRVGQVQLFLDNYNLLLIGGFTESNSMLRDSWILRMTDTCENWSWQKLTVSSSKVFVAPKFLYNNTVCRIGNYIVAFAQEMVNSTKIVIRSKTSHRPQAETDSHHPQFNIVMKQRRRKLQLKVLEKFENKWNVNYRKNLPFKEQRLKIFVSDISEITTNCSYQWKSSNAYVHSENINGFFLVHGTHELLLFGGKCAKKRLNDTDHDIPLSILRVLQCKNKVI